MSVEAVFGDTRWLTDLHLRQQYLAYPLAVVNFYLGRAAILRISSP